jgi:hypothetical protein
MERSSAPDLGVRVARLESSSRRDRAIVIAIAVLAFATAQAPGASKTPVVIRDASGASATLTGKGLTVRDTAGHTRAFVGLDADSRPSVDLGDTAGRLRESMYLLNELPVLRQFDSNGKRRAEIRLDSSNDGELLLSDANEKLRLALFRTSSGDPQLGLYGSDEKLRAYFATDDVSPYLVMKDSGGTSRVVVGGYTDGSLGIDIRNASNTVVWKAP